MSYSMGSVKFRTLATIIYRYPTQPRRNLFHGNHNRTFSSNYGLMFSSLIGSNSASSTKSVAEHIETNDDKIIAKQMLPGPVKPSFPSWAKWVLGSFLSIVLPFWKQKWVNLLILGGTVEKVVDEVEMVAEVVEKVASVAETASADVANKLPEDGLLKEAVLVVEHVSTKAAKDAQVTQNIIHKVEELEHDLTDLGTIVKPIINEIVNK